MPKKLDRLNIKIYRGQPAVRFNPSEYKTAYRQYQTGVFRNLITMMKRAEADSHIYGCIGGRIAGFQKGWQFSAFEQDSAEDQKRADWFTKVFNQYDTYNLFIDMQEPVIHRDYILQSE